MSRYRIIERVGDRYERVEAYEDLERHHPSSARQPGRDYATIDGRLEEVRHLEDGRLLVKKDFILLRDTEGPVYVPAPASGYVHHLNDPTNAIRIYDHPAGRDSARLLAQSLHMQQGSSPPQGSWIDYGMPLGRMGDVGSPGSVHVHLEAEPAQYRRYIQDISAGNITPDRHPVPQTAAAVHVRTALVDVRALQHALNQLGHRDQDGRMLEIDGIAGSRTVHATRVFQREHKLGIDGIPGPVTLKALEVALVEQPLRDRSRPPVVLRQGSAGAEVAALQSVLGRLGYDEDRPLLVDRSFGPATSRAVDRFQRAHGLVPDRVVGVLTYAAIRSSLDRPLVSERTHPQHALYRQATAALGRLQSSSQGAPAWPRGLATQLAIAAHDAGLTRIDSVLLGSDGTRVFAVQGGAQEPAQRHASLDMHSAPPPPLAQGQVEPSQAPAAPSVVLEAMPVRHRALVP